MKTVKDISSDRLPHYRGHSLPISLLRAREAMMQYFRPMLAQFDLTEQQWRVIRVLSDVGPTDASTVAEEAFVLAPSLTRILRSLEERKLITRVADARDGRRLLIDLTPLGHTLIERIVPESRAIYKMFEDHFGKEKISMLLELLNELQDVNTDRRTRG